MMYTIKDLIIYPIKGLAGIYVEKAKALPAGFEYDRRWMLIDEAQKFVTQRTQPKMALFIPEIKDGEIIVSYQNNSISFYLHKTLNGDVIKTKVWDDDVLVQQVSKDASAWFSEMLGQQVDLVRILDDKARIHHNSTKNIDIHVSLADGYPYLVIGTSSLQYLNQKLASPIEMNRFRPNLVVETTEAHEEDTWNKIQIGSASFLNIKPCARCNVITINQKDATIQNEVLKVLNTYRKEGNSVLFGTNVMCTSEGIVSVGDSIIH